MRSYRTMTKFTALLLSFTLIFAAAVLGTFGYLIAGTSPIRNVFIPVITQDSELILSKTVQHPFGDSYALPDGLTFPFAVDLGQRYGGRTLNTSQGQVTADETGRILVDVPVGRPLSVKDLQPDIQVTVTELLPEDSSFSALGENPRTLTLGPGRNRVVVTNTYAPGPADTSGLTVSGTKLLEGRQWQEGDSFSFRLDYQNGFDGTQYSWLHLGTETVTYSLEESTDPEKPGLVPVPDFDKFDFTQLIQGFAFDSPGSHSFRITEQEDTIGGVTYDKTVAYFTVLVGDADMDGSLEIQNVTGSGNTAVTRQGSGFDVDVTLINRYAPEGSAQVVINITKLLEDSSGQNRPPEGFSFRLLDAEGFLVAESEATSAAGETAIKLVYDAAQAGQSFRYTLLEYQGSTDGIIYDGTEIPLLVQVIDNLDGTISAVISEYVEPNPETAPEEAETPEPLPAGNTFEALFTNAYDPMDAWYRITGTKRLSGRELREGEFTFNLYQTGADFVVIQGAAAIRTAQNDAQGTFRFQAIPFNEVGTNYFVVEEDTSLQQEGITYDDTRYLVTVTVSDIGGTLTAVASVTSQSGEDVQEFLFVNTYTEQIPTEPDTEPTEPSTEPTEPEPTGPKPTEPEPTEPEPTEPEPTEPEPTEPEPTEPEPTEPEPTEPEPTEPEPTEPEPTEPEPTEPEPTEPEPTEPEPTEPKPTEPEPTEPEPTEPEPTEPKPTEPEPTEPEPTEPEPTEPEPTEPEPTEPEPTGPKPTEPEPTEPEPTEPEPTEPEPTEPEPTEPKPTEPEPTEPEPTETEPTEPEPTVPEPTETEPTEPEPTESEPTEPCEPTTGKPSDTPDTGDRSHVGLYLALMLLSLGAILVLLAVRHRAKKTRHHRR